MPFQIIRNDITKVSADAIVNTANPEPVYAGGTDAAVYLAAGEKELLAERRKIGRIMPGEVAVTSAFALDAKYIIHTVGPVWIDGDHGEYEQLASCYRKSLLIARQLGCESIAFPLISTGVYGFPKDRALDIALREISAFLEDSEMEITLVVFDRKAFDLSAGLVTDVGQYIDEHYVEERTTEEYAIDNLPSGVPSDRRRRAAFARRLENRLAMQRPRDESLPELSGGAGPLPAQDSQPSEEEHKERPAYSVKIPRSRRDLRTDTSLPDQMQDSLLMEEEAPYESGKDTIQAGTIQADASDAAAMSEADIAQPAAASPSAETTASRPQRSLQDVMSQVGESFRECLLRLIDERGFTDAQVYKRANIDRKLFSKIRCNPDYMPRRKTIISLAVALELNMDEMVDLLRKAGIALSPGSKFDLIIRYCVENRIYDTMTINALLFDYGQPQLGA